MPGTGVLCSGTGPWGIDGTPVIDDAAGVIYLDALVVSAGGSAQHLVYGLSLKTGAMLPGWPVNVASALRAKGIVFTPKIQDQRGALALIGGRLYVPFGGNGGDCGNYHGWVVGLDVATASIAGSWETHGPKGGIWAAGGVVSDGTSLFFGTGNTQLATMSSWQEGEAVIRLRPDLQHSADTHDFFTPSNWQTLDADDLDLGGTAPLPIDVPTSAGSAKLLLALGKDGRAYVMDRANLGGVGGELLVQAVATSHIITAPASYTAADGVYVSFKGAGVGCPAPATNIALTTIKITAQPKLAISTVWCAAYVGTGSPTVTTSDGVHDPIVWVLGAEGDALLHGCNMLTGATLFTSSMQFLGARRLTTTLAADGRLFVAGGRRLFSLSFGP